MPTAFAKWWDEQTLVALSHARTIIKELEGSVPRKACDLLKVEFTAFVGDL